MAIFEEEFKLNVPYDEVWRFFCDFPAPVLCLPQLEDLMEVGTHRYRGTLGLHIGLFHFKFRGHLQIAQIEPEHGRVVIRGSAEDPRFGATIKGVAYTQTHPLGIDRSLVTLAVHTDFAGIIGTFGMRLLKPKAGQIVAAYADLVTAAIVERRLSAPQTKSA